MSNITLSAGQKVELNDSRIGTVRFVGTTQFQTGDWVGVELNDASGKNDGSVQGQRYFDCAPKHGIFCRPSGVSRVIEEPKPKPKPAGNGVPVKGRPSSLHAAVNGARRQTLTQDTPGKRASAIQGTPTPAPRVASGMRSPAKSPTKQLGLTTTATSSASTSRTSTPPVAGRRPTTTTTGASAKPRSSLAPSTASAARRTSTLPSAASSRTAGSTTSSTSARSGLLRPAPGTAAASRLAPAARARAATKDRLSSTTEGSTNDEASEAASTRESIASSIGTRQGTENGESEDVDDTITNFAPPAPPPIPPEPAERTTRARRPSSPSAASVHSQRTIRSTAQTKREIEELQARVHQLERQGIQNRELKQKLEQAEQERDTYKKIIDKLQAKYKPVLDDNERMKKEITEYETRITSVEQLQAEHEADMESLLLDRELAEETAEGLKADLEAVRARNEEMSLELEVLRDENSELGREVSPEERNSVGWLQLERSNERLKEGLLRLRDLAGDREAELKEEIQNLESQVKEVDSLKSHYEETREKLLRTEANELDLKQQLDVALGAEEMIEELGQENLNLKEKINDLNGVIEDLENLREINDELEVNHVEAEKQLQEEIDFKDSLLLDRERTAKEQQKQLDDADQNIVKFRALVQEMSSHLQDLQASKQISESEAAELSSRSRAMQELNHKLQDSAAKTQVKTIDLELRRLDAEQASEHLAIVQLFLPAAFQAERDSVLSLLRFKRIAFKANLVQSFVRERIASYGTRGQDEEVFAACAALDKLTWIASMSDRLVHSISSCSIEAFANYGGALYELEVVERALNDFVDALRRDDLKESDMAARLGRSIEVMTHLSSLHLNDSLADHSDGLTMQTALLQSRLDSAISALAIVKGMYETKLPRSSEDDEYEDENVSDTALIVNRIKSIIEQARNAKVISGKTHRALAELQARQLTLEQSLTESFDDAEALASTIAAYACQTGTDLQLLFSEEGRAEPFTPSEVSTVLARHASRVFAIPGAEAGPYATLNSRLRDLTALLADLSVLPTDLDNTVEFERASAPWIARADAIKKAKEANMDLEAELARAQEAIRDRDSIIKQKEKDLNVEAIKTETFEARLKEASKRSATIADLEGKVRDAETAEKKAKADLSRAHQDAQSELDRVREEMSRLAEERRKGGALKDIDGNAMGNNTRLVIQRHEYKIAGLESAVRHLKDENTRLRLPAPDSPQTIKSSIDWLIEPIHTSQPGSRPRLPHREGEKVFESMLRLATRPPSIDLSKLPQNKLAWRPAKEGSRWKIESRHEEWAEWKHWRQEVLDKALMITTTVSSR